MIDASALHASDVELIVNGGTGDDRAILGAGDDDFIWNPGDGSDFVDGRDGTDTLEFNGADATEGLRSPTARAASSCSAMSATSRWTSRTSSGSR